MAQVFLYCVLLLGGLMVAGATGELVSAAKYGLLFGPGELARFVSCLGEKADTKSALKSALAREYGSSNTAQVIHLLSDRYNAAHPVKIPALRLSIDDQINCQNPLDGIVAAGQANGDF